MEAHRREDTMSDISRDDAAVSDDPGMQPLRDGDTSVEADPAADPAQAEWDTTTALDEGADLDELDPTTATGDDPALLRRDDEEIPAADLAPSAFQPESQGDDPTIADLGEDGQGDLAPEDY
jgi:hypothetical protein